MNTKMNYVVKINFKMFLKITAMKIDHQLLIDSFSLWIINHLILLNLQQLLLIPGKSRVKWKKMNSQEISPLISEDLVNAEKQKMMKKW
jgi:hypothetical protein